MPEPLNRWMSNMYRLPRLFFCLASWGVARKNQFIMRSLLFSLFLCGSLCTFAQGMTATLQHGENTKFFYGYQSFAEAYENAENGDVITLSKGNFNTIDCIEKSVSVIGNFAFSANEECTVLSDIKVSADNVCLSGIRVTGSLRMALSNNLQIKRCYVQNLRADTTHTRTLIEDCAINNDFSLPWGIDESYRRSEIFRYHKANTPENMANFEYCTIYNPAIEEIDVKYVHGLKSFKNQLASYGTYRNCAISSHVSVQNNLSYLYTTVH